MGCACPGHPRCRVLRPSRWAVLPGSRGGGAPRGSDYHPLPGLPAAAAGTKRASSRVPRPPLPGAWTAPGLSQITMWFLEIPLLAIASLPLLAHLPPAAPPTLRAGVPQQREGRPHGRATKRPPTPGAKEATTRPCSLFKGSPSPLLSAPTPPLAASAPALTSCLEHLLLSRCSPALLPGDGRPQI